jgi:hypothetical protein
MRMAYYYELDLAMGGFNLAFGLAWSVLDLPAAEAALLAAFEAGPEHRTVGAQA